MVEEVRWCAKSKDGLIDKLIITVLDGYSHVNRILVWETHERNETSVSWQANKGREREREREERILSTTQFVIFEMWLILKTVGVRRVWNKITSKVDQMSVIWIQHTVFIVLQNAGWTNWMIPLEGEFKRSMTIIYIWRSRKKV